jgi:hypothetical protein
VRVFAGVRRGRVQIGVSAVEAGVKPASIAETAVAFSVRRLAGINRHTAVEIVTAVDRGGGVGCRVRALTRASIRVPAVVVGARHLTVGCRGRAIDEDRAVGLNEEVTHADTGAGCGESG